MFPSSIGSPAMKWFHQLSENSMSSWNELARIFMARFIANNRDLTTLDTTPEETRVSQSLCANLDYGSTKKYDYIVGKDKAEGSKRKDNRKADKGEGGREKESSKAPNPNSYKAMRTIFKDPMYQILPQIVNKLFFRRPNKMAGDPSTRNQSK
ncbi:uncharacterized protein LOC119992776 [Tripterygium wilfordii]|uniref:uncharacterized protein LOC119992776 n=1 Tax=Tripterygium wilfordii TaxID=458696 RepID=UPI0018F855D3|nr:uncharacterized protein LOC119992776 [Tripterygium wilfordii]